MSACQSRPISTGKPATCYGFLLCTYKGLERPLQQEIESMGITCHLLAHRSGVVLIPASNRDNNIAGADLAPTFFKEGGDHHEPVDFHC